MRSLRAAPDEPVTAVVYATKGLVDVVAAEVTELVPARIVERTDRFLLVRLTPAQLADLGARARTVDDVRLLVAGPAPVTGAGDLQRLGAVAADAVEARLGASEEPWSVTLAARNPPWRRRPRWEPAPVLAATLHGADAAATARRPVDLRLQVDGEQAHLAVNLWERPLGKADGPAWRGALRPTVAAALVRIALGAAGPAARAAGLYDPFCGSGTIVAEAARAGLAVQASDRAPEAVALTRERLAALGVPDPQVFVRDVLRGPDQRVSARIVVGNLPWGTQQPVDGRIALFDAVAHLVAQRVAGDGAAALLTTHEEALVARLRRHGLAVTARRIGLLGQTPAVVTAHPA
ncbi:TRM11 family SAM-dependent methyltransferase [Pseudonocardia sp. CA-107938]|uniref:TRM11 family SAM-dependent methyltransferase n=1 Tax=Pseudonocardia sp. CA-107938 TaxID=3240021 RepID=UPI003D90395F